MLVLLTLSPYVKPAPSAPASCLVAEPVKPMSEPVPYTANEFLYFVLIEPSETNAPTVEVWGTGVATREFLYVGDTVKAIIDAINCNETGPFNLGTGTETSIKELIETISSIIGYKGKIVWDTNRPDGQLKRFYDMDKFEKEFGYVPNTPLKKGLEKTIEWYLNNEDIIRL